VKRVLEGERSKLVAINAAQLLRFDLRLSGHTAKQGIGDDELLTRLRAEVVFGSGDFVKPIGDAR
jgi:hypothetical protein